MKARADGAIDEPADVEAIVWAGVVPVRREFEHRSRTATRSDPSRPTSSPARGSIVSLAMTQRTLVLLKPDAVRRSQVGEIIRRIEAKGYALVALDLRSRDPELLAEHYAEHEGKPFYQPLVDFMLSGPVVAVLEGERCIEGFRSLARATDPTAAAPGTIRGDLGRDWGLAVQQNLVHGSDSEESAAREIGIWFPQL